MHRFLTGFAMPRKLLGELPQQLFNGLLLKNKLVMTCARACPGGQVPPRFPLLLSTHLNAQTFVEEDVVYQVHDHAFNIYLVMDGIFGYVGEVEESRFDFGKGAFVTRQTTPKNITLTTHLATVGKSTSIPGKQLRVRPSTVMNPPDDRRAYSSREGHTSSMLEQNHGAWTPKPKSADTPGSSSGSGRHSRSLAEQPHQFGEPPWLQVDLGKVKKVKGIVMQGHPKEDQWVKKYKVQYSLLEDGPWVEVEDVLIGCADRNTECQA
ncbi:unnamed protein product, partial [Prorocentrum cordatum]